MERFSLKELNSVYVTIYNQNLQNIDDSANIIGTLDTIKENIMIHNDSNCKHSGFL
jgi:hypothetical protein